MKEDSDPSFSGELACLPEWDRAFWLSRAFLEASRCLCASMMNGEFSSQYSSSRVVLHLTRQAIELFLKAAIGAAPGHGAAPATHNLSTLFLEYRRRYPALIFAFDIPPRFSVSLNLDLFPDDQDTFHATLDQRHRYPSDRKGHTFASPEVFDPVATLSELEALDRTLKILESACIRPYLRGQPPGPAP